jgi:23S rRNA (uracil1939-C5)-methyltransferase
LINDAVLLLPTTYNLLHITLHGLPFTFSTYSLVALKYPYFCAVRNNKKRQVILENITIEAIAAEGKSLARVNGKVVFVEGVIPGDIVNIQLTKSKKDWAEGYALNIIQPSANRLQPFCQHFGVCGGCQWQMLPYHEQLQFKQQQVTDHLQRIGKVALPAIQPIIGGTETTAYRNKLEYTFATRRFVPKAEFQQLKAANNEEAMLAAISNAGGFHAKGQFDKVVAIEHCHLQAEPTNAIRNFIVAFCREHQYTFYDIKNHTGWLRNMMVRLATTGQIMVNIVLGEKNKAWQQHLFAALETNFPMVTTWLYTINTKFNDSIYDLEPIVHKGNGYIVEKLENFEFIISPKSFFQTNTKQAEKLYQVTRSLAQLTGKETLYDLYCGTGSIGIFCSQQAQKIVGVELIPQAIHDANKNAVLNNLENAFFTAGDVIDVCNTEFFEAHGKPDVIITDPPRAGMHEKLTNKIIEMAAPLVVYVSCNVATQARDLALLNEAYEITHIQPVDMFPHTHHIENVVQLKRR